MNREFSFHATNRLVDLYDGFVGTGKYSKSRELVPSGGVEADSCGGFVRSFELIVDVGGW